MVASLFKIRWQDPVRDRRGPRFLILQSVSLASSVVQLPSKDRLIPPTSPNRMDVTSFLYSYQFGNTNPEGMSPMSTPVYKNLIAGEWVASCSGKTILNINPARNSDV